MRNFTHFLGLFVALLTPAAFVTTGRAQSPNGALVYQDDFSGSNSLWQFGFTDTQSNSAAIAASYGNISGGTLNLKANVDCGWDYLHSWAALDVPLPPEFIAEFSLNKLEFCGNAYVWIGVTNTLSESMPSPFYFIGLAGNWFDGISYFPMQTNGIVIASPISSPMNDGQAYNWRIEKRDKSLRIYINGSLQYSFNGTLFSGGFLLFQTGQAGSTVQVDNLKIYEFPATLSISTAAFNLSWFAASSVTYQVQWSTNLQTWTTLTNVIGAGYNTNIVDWVSGPRKYYRLIGQ